MSEQIPPLQLYTDLMRHYTDCQLCPRRCHADRLSGQTGYCRQTAHLKAARAALHMWEEPCISGAAGSGTVFFSGCNLRCRYCQNYDIAHGQTGREISADRLAEIFLELQQNGAANINLVTPTHYIPSIVYALEHAKSKGLSLPIVYNCGGYEDAEALHLLNGLIDIYLPDLKYVSSELSAGYSQAADYFDKAKSALAEMFRQVGKPVFRQPSLLPTEGTSDSSSSISAPNEPVRAGNACNAAGIDKTVSRPVPVYPADTPLMSKGMIVRHLVLPGQIKDTKKVLHYLHDTYGESIYVSVMCQYTPLSHIADIPELNRRVTSVEYDRVVNYCLRLGMENVYIQEGDVAQESFIPPFDLSGL